MASSFPHEFIAHLSPLLFVSGLGPPPPPPAAPAPAASPPTTTTAAGLSPLLAPSPERLLSDSEDAKPVLGEGVQMQAGPEDPFRVLVDQLRGLFLGMGKGRAAIWDPARGGRVAFVASLVDKNLRLPPLKTPTAPPPSPSSSVSQNPPYKSPLSPAHPASPLYPDGLIAPIWVRKHRELVPAVWVCFWRVCESEDEEEVRRRDRELVGEIMERKRGLLERGIKFTVVLLASRRLLDDPALDPRLSSIRRLASLDSKASLFVLSPVPLVELQDFLSSLCTSILPSALAYFTEHSKSVRRKRFKAHRQSLAEPLAAGAAGRPLGSQGWAVRYEYKMGVFAEFRGEGEVARKHYEDAYLALLEMFGSTALLPPRTKRWAEAKVLADTLNFKIAKHYLYHDEPARALAHLNRHLARFAELSNGWGIGEETPEWWSWLSKQYRLFAHLIDLALRSGLRIPFHQPPPTTGPHAPLPSTAVNPATALQSPGYYYYLAARAAATRRDRFRAAMDAPGAKESQALALEGKVDHAGIIVELYEKAYEVLKRVGKTNERLTLLVAARLAETHYDAGRYAIALRFYDRIARTYRREGWTTILASILERAYDCAKRTEDRETAVRFGVECLGQREERVQEELLRIEAEVLEMLETPPASADKQPVKPDMSTSSPLFRTSAVFLHPTLEVHDSTPFQLHIASSTGVHTPRLPFSALRIEFADGRAPVVVRHAAEAGDKAQVIELGDLGVREGGGQEGRVWEANLRWESGERKVFEGRVEGRQKGELKITATVFIIEQNGWTVEIAHDPTASTDRALWSGADGKLRPVELEHPAFAVVERRRPKIEVDLRYDAPAYLGEKFPIVVEARNVDERSLEVSLDVLLQPAEDDVENSITLDNETSTGLIKGSALGVLPPGGRASKTVLLRALGAAGERLLDISVLARAVREAREAEEEKQREKDAEETASETLRTLAVPTAHAVHAAWESKVKAPQGAVGLLEELEEEPEVGAVEVLGRLGAAAGGEGVEVLRVGVVCEANPDIVRMKGTSLDRDERGLLPARWKFGEDFAFSYVLALLDEDEDAPAGSPGWLEVVWRRPSTSVESPSEPTTSRLPLPPVPPLPPSIHAILTPPPAPLTLHKPTRLLCVLTNASSTRRTADLSLHVDSSDTFVFAGPRQVRIPRLLLGMSWTGEWEVIPLRVGEVKLPRVRVWEMVGRSAEAQQPDQGREVRVTVLGKGGVGEAGREEERRSAESARPVEEGVWVFVKPA